MELCPPTARESHPIFPIGNAARKCQKSKKIQSQTYKTPSERKSPQWFQTRENWKQNDIKTPCERMIHLCFGTIPPLFEKACDPNVQNNIINKKKHKGFVEAFPFDLPKRPKARNSFPISATNSSGQILLFFKQSIEFPSCHAIIIVVDLSPRVAFKSRVLNEAKTWPKRGPDRSSPPPEKKTRQYLITEHKEYRGYGF